MPEHDLPLADAEDRRRPLARTVALLLRALAEDERGPGRVAVRPDRDQPARARQCGVPSERVRVCFQTDSRAGLNDLGARREELRGRFVVAGVELLAPGSNNALR